MDSDLYVSFYMLHLAMVNRLIHVLSADIDECELQIDGCQQICINMDGAYECRCGAGFELQVDNQSCAG